VGKHDRDPKKDKPFEPKKPDGGNKSGGRDGKHGSSGGRDGKPSSGKCGGK
jgi:hypothetical protein